MRIDVIANATVDFIASVIAVTPLNVRHVPHRYPHTCARPAFRLQCPRKPMRRRE